MRALLKRLQDLGKTILVSSHILPELADICNRVGIIEYGQLLAQGDVTDLLAKVRGRPVFCIEVEGDPEKSARLLEDCPGIAEVNIREGIIRATLDNRAVDVSLLPATIVASGERLLGMREEEINLETAFLELTKGSLGRQADDAPQGWGKLQDGHSA
jgi:ABC-2 type transport system ATP-binding protein